MNPTGAPNCALPFSCNSVPVQIDYIEPDGSGMVYVQEWAGGAAFDTPGDNQEDIFAAFSGVDAAGNIIHPNAPTSSGIIPGGGLGISNPDNSNAEQFQVDAWVAVPPNFSCITFRIGSGSRIQASAFQAGIDFNSMTAFGSELNGTDTDISVSTDGATTFGCGWQLIRTRVYVSDDFAFYNGIVQWDVGSGFTNVPTNYVMPATSPTDLSLIHI